MTETDILCLAFIAKLRTTSEIFLFFFKNRIANFVLFYLVLANNQVPLLYEASLFFFFVSSEINVFYLSET